VLAYYKKSPDLSVQSYHAPSDRGGYRKTDRNDAPPQRFEAPAGGMVAVRVNLGRKNNLTPPVLISLINRATQGPKLALGKIKIADTSTTFDIAKSGAAKMTKILSQFKYYDKPVFAEVIQA